MPIEHEKTKIKAIKLTGEISQVEQTGSMND